MSALREHLFRGQKIEAIKLYRELTDVGLKDAKEEVERLENALRKEHPEKFSVSAKGKGCLGSAAALSLCLVVGVYWLARQ